MFEPKRLIQTRKDIELVHPIEHEVVNAQPSSDLMGLILRLAGLELYQVKGAAFALTAKEALLVAAYIPHNHYGVTLSNLLSIFRYRSNDYMCDVIYSEWQDSYDNRECNAFFQELLELDEEFILMIRQNGMSESFFSSLLKEQNIAYALGKELKNRYFATNLSFEGKLGSFGIRNSSKLFHECEFLFYTFCEKNDYLSAEPGKILNVLKRYDDDVLKKFLQNFLNLLSLRELEGFRFLQSYLISRTGDVKSVMIDVFFEGLPFDIKRKYVNWINIRKIEEIFGYDERSIFWKQFEFISVEKHTYSDSVILELDNYYVTEFLGKAMGPMYFFNKDIFDSRIRRWFRYYSNSELRSALYNHEEYWSKDSVFYSSGQRSPRIEHRKDKWESQVRNLLIKNNIARKLDY